VRGDRAYTRQAQHYCMQQQHIVHKAIYIGYIGFQPDTPTAVIVHSSSGRDSSNNLIFVQTVEALL